MSRAASFLARLLVGLAGCAILTGIALLVLAGYVATWPLRSKPAHERQLRAALNAGAAIVALVQVIRREQPPAPQPPEPPARTTRPRT